MMQILLLALLTVSPADSYNQGNKYYENGNYSGAIAEYQNALTAVSSSHIYYNLGNVYFKNGQIGQAIINYRRARFLDPRDPDINNNLVFARNYRIDKVLTTTGPLDNLIGRLFNSISFAESFWLCLIFFGLFSAFVSLFILNRRRIYLYSSTIAGLFFLLSLLSLISWQNEKRSSPAVVIIPEVSALSGPGEEFKQILLLHDGTEVLIKEKRNDFLLVQLPGGTGGWLKKETIERIY
ncbi:MAG: tetratricopeptide repeat protein [Candidatus Edwardsbacteria bacterium]|nr:tetratricopeptide repeat protein [Candidatus Edwardsbacteria bacterium]